MLIGRITHPISLAVLHGFNPLLLSVTKIAALIQGYSTSGRLTDRSQMSVRP